MAKSKKSIKNSLLKYEDLNLLSQEYTPKYFVYEKYLNIVNYQK
jgi:hypothetical protein